MRFINKLVEYFQEDKQKEVKNKDYIYEEGKKFEITGGAFFKQIFSFGKIEYRYKKDNKMYVILPLYIHYCDAHDDGGWTDWQGIDENNESTIVFDEYGDWAFDDLRYVAFEIPKDQDNCSITRNWGMYAGWKEDGEDNYHYIPIMINFNLTNLSSLPVVDDEVLRDGYLIINNELHRYNECMKEHDNEYYLSLLDKKYNNIEVIKRNAFHLNWIPIEEIIIPKLCKKIETEAFVGCIIDTLVIPQGCDVVLKENAFVNCIVYEVQCPKQYEDICKKMFKDAEIIITD